MLLADLGQHQLIIGRRWLAEHKIWLDVENRRLVWPDKRTPVEEVSEPLQTVVPRRILPRPKPDATHQADMERRDRLLEQQD
jgi:hypothetical protein